MQRLLVRRRQRRRIRGATMVEYILILTIVVIPSVAGAIACIAGAYAWYVRFEIGVSQPYP